MADKDDKELDESRDADMPEPPEPPPLPFDYKASCEIELTAEQKAIVKRETGRNMDVLILEDDDGEYTKGMKEATPDDFTLIAIRQAKRLNDYDADYHQYLIDLDEWQKSLNDPDPGAQLAEVAEIAAMQEAERLKLFFQAEADVCMEARSIAKMEFGQKPKG